MAQPKKDAAQGAFLAALLEGLSVIDAAEQARVPRRTFYNWRAEDIEFRAAWHQAYEQGTDLLEKEAQRRAVEGVDEPRMIGQGDNAELITVRKYSDTLLIFLLKARRPGKFRERVQVDHGLEGGKPIVIEHRGVSLADLFRVAEDTGAVSDT